MDLTDEALIDIFRETKDSSYFRTLVGRYQNRLYGLAVRIVGNSQEAEEVVQETYIKVHQNLDRFSRENSFASWIFRITHNLCVDLLRAKQRRGLFDILSFDGKPSYGYEQGCESSQSIPQVADHGFRPDVQLDISEQSEVIQQCLKQLPEAQRIVLVLHDIEGFAYQDIAEIVGTTIGTVRSRVYYGRMRLRELLEPYFSSKCMSPAAR